MAALTPRRLSPPPRSPRFMCTTFRPFRRQPPLAPRRCFRTLPLSSPGLRDLHVPVWASPSWDRLAAFQAESRSLSYGLVIRLPLLLTPPRGDAITVDYRPESACLKRTFTAPIAHTHGRTPRSAKRTAGARLSLRIVARPLYPTAPTAGSASQPPLRCGTAGHGGRLRRLPVKPGLW